VSGKRKTLLNVGNGARNYVSGGRLVVRSHRPKPLGQTKLRVYLKCDFNQTGSRKTTSYLIFCIEYLLEQFHVLSK
jgi:hypothetical protein